MNKKRPPRVSRVSDLLLTNHCDLKSPTMLMGGSIKSGASLSPLNSGNGGNGGNGQSMTGSSMKTQQPAAFVSKLYRMISEPSTNYLIQWSLKGDTFIVTRPEDFAREILPKYFKHNNFSSFVRQLNMYGFHKVPHLQQGVLMVEGEVDTSWEFVHIYFQRDRVDLLPLVKRKVTEEKEKEKDKLEAGPYSVNDNTGMGYTSTAMNSGGVMMNSGGLNTNYSVSEGTVRPMSLHPHNASSDGTVGLYSGESYTTPYSWNVPTTSNFSSNTTPYYSEIGFLLGEMTQIRRQQELISQTLTQIEHEHSTLLQETSVLRDRYENQQEMIDKILRFLASIFAGGTLGAPGSAPLGDFQGLIEVLRKSAATTTTPGSSALPASPWLASTLDSQHPLRKRKLITGGLNDHQSINENRNRTFNDNQNSNENPVPIKDAPVSFMNELAFEHHGDSTFINNASDFTNEQDPMLYRDPMLCGPSVFKEPYNYGYPERDHVLHPSLPGGTHDLGLLSPPRVTELLDGTELPNTEADMTALLNDNLDGSLLDASLLVDPSSLASPLKVSEDPLLTSPLTEGVAASRQHSKPLKEPFIDGCTLSSHGSVSPTTRLKTAKEATENLHNDIDALQLDLEELSQSLGLADPLDGITNPMDLPFMKGI